MSHSNHQIPTRHNIYGDSNNEELINHLSISAPPSDRKMEALSFKRLREAEFDWNIIVGTQEYGDRPLHYMREFLHESWGLSADSYDSALVKSNITIDAASNTAQFTHLPSERVYIAMPIANATIEGTDLDDEQSYNRFWNKIDSFQDKVESEFEELDLSPSVIINRFNELDSLLDFARALDKGAGAIEKKVESGEILHTEVESLMVRYSSMRAPLRDIQRELEELRDQASDLGYILPLNNRDFKFPDGSTTKLRRGELFKPYKTTVRWKTHHTKTEVKKYKCGLFNMSTCRRRIKVDYHKDHKRQVTKYDKVIVDFDPWVEKENELKLDGFNTFRFRLEGGNYLTDNNMDLQSALEQCANDENVRKETAILLPIYEQSLSRGDTLVRYLIIKKPLPGIQSIRYPELYFSEELLYNLAFKGAEIGELLSSINLAPGEQRTVSVSSKTTQRSEFRSSASTLLDITNSRSNSLAIEIEKESRRESEKTSNSNWNAKVGGSYGFFSGSAGAGGESSKTVKDFSRNVQKTARKASSNYNARNKTELSTEANSSSSIEHASSTEIQVSNINDGKSLNLLFYQLNNIYESKIILSDISFVVVPSREAIAGTGLTLPVSYELNELSIAMMEFEPSKLPLPNRINDQSNEYWAKIINTMLAALKLEFKSAIGDNEDYRGTAALIAEITPEIVMGDENADPALTSPNRKVIKDKIELFQRKAGELIDNEISMLSDTLVLASGALHLDGQLGVKDSTEPFAEELRIQEIRLKAADVYEKKAKADYYNRISDSTPPSTPADLVDIAVIARKQGGRHLELYFSDSPPQGDWTLVVDGVDRKSFQIPQGEVSVRLEWPDRQSWLGGAVADTGTLLHVASGKLIPFLI